MKRRRPTTLEPVSPAVFLVVALHLAAALGVWWSFQNVKNSRHSSIQRQLAWMNPSDFQTVVPPLSPPRGRAAAAPSAKPAPIPTPVPVAVAAPVAPPPPAAPDAPVQKATLVAAPPQQHVMEPVANPTTPPLFAPPTPAVRPSANRSITLRRTLEKPSGPTAFDSPAPPMTSPTLMDVARLNALRPTAVAAPGSVPKSAGDEANMDAIDEAVNTAFLSSWVAPPITSVPENQREARLSISISKDGSVIKSQMTKFSHSHSLDESVLEAAAKVKKISASLPSNYTKESYDLELNFILLP